jgi:hypothetical protein
VTLSSSTCSLERQNSPRTGTCSWRIQSAGFRAARGLGKMQNGERSSRGSWWCAHQRGRRTGATGFSRGAAADDFLYPWRGRRSGEIPALGTIGGVQLGAEVLLAGSICSGCAPKRRIGFDPAVVAMADSCGRLVLCRGGEDQRGVQLRFAGLGRPRIYRAGWGVGVACTAQTPERRRAGLRRVLIGTDCGWARMGSAGGLAGRSDLGRGDNWAVVERNTWRGSGRRGRLWLLGWKRNWAKRWEAVFERVEKGPRCKTVLLTYGLKAAAGQKLGIVFFIIFRKIY